MKIFATIPCMLVALSLGGCVPNAVTYYRPSVVGGTIVEPHCVPTKSMVEFDLAGNHGNLRVRAWAYRSKRLNDVNLFFSGKTWKEVHFTSTTFRLRDIETHRLIDASSVMTHVKDGSSRLTVEPYVAPPERPGVPRHFIQVIFADPLPEKFELLVPPIVIDGKEVAFPTIRFEQKLWVGLSPFNC